MHRELLQLLLRFEWDTGNATKNQESHNVSQREAEEVFVNDNIMLLEDEQHSLNEMRYYVFGSANKGRLLTITFTVRNASVRVIMARDMSRKERVCYEKEIKKNPLV